MSRNLKASFAVSFAACAAIFSSAAPSTGAERHCPAVEAAEIASVEAADAYLATRFGGLNSGALPVYQVRRWLACGGQAEAQGRALDLASPGAVADVAEALLAGETATVLRRSVSRDHAGPLQGVLFHPAFLDHVNAASPTRVAAWDALAGALEGAYDAGSPKVEHLAASQQF